MNQMISRSYPAEVEVRRGSAREVTAYASVYGTEAEIRDRHGHYREVIRAGAFRESIARGFSNVDVLWNHGHRSDGTPDGLLSVTIGRPVSVKEDRRGLLTVTKFNDGPVAEQALAAIKAGDVKGFSFRGPVHESYPSRVPTIRRGGQLPLIERRRLGLVEYGPTKTPFYEGASVVAVRSRMDTFRERVMTKQLDIVEAGRLAKQLGDIMRAADTDVVLRAAVADELDDLNGGTGTDQVLEAFSRILDLADEDPELSRAIDLEWAYRYGEVAEERDDESEADYEDEDA